VLDAQDDGFKKELQSLLEKLNFVHLLIIFHLDLKIPRTTLWKPRYTMAKNYSTTTNLGSDLEECKTKIIAGL
jgi:hypothetical protein